MGFGCRSGYWCGCLFGSYALLGFVWILRCVLLLTWVLFVCLGFVNSNVLFYFKFEIISFTELFIGVWCFAVGVVGVVCGLLVALVCLGWF